MANDLNIPPLAGDDVESVKRWARQAVPVFNQLIRNLTNPGFFTWDKGCLEINTSTTIAGADELFFESPVTGNGSLLVTAVGLQGAKIALNAVTLVTTLSNTDTTAEIGYEAAVTNLAEGNNSFKIWDTGTAGGELRRLEVRGLDSGGYKGYGALANQGTLNSGVQIFEPGNAESRRLANAISLLEVTDGQSVTFDPARPDIPKIWFVGGGAGMPTGTSLTGSAWYREVKATNTSTSGFDVSAKFRTDFTAPTNVTDTGATGDNTARVIEKTASQEDNDDSYLYQFDIQVAQATEQVIEGETVVIPKTVTIAFDTRTILAGAWTERDTAVYQNNDPDAVRNILNATKTIVVDGLGADAAFRVRVKSGNGSVTAFDQVTYSHGGGAGASETMTPGNGEQPILVVVSGGGEETIE